MLLIRSMLWWYLEVIISVSFLYFTLSKGSLEPVMWLFAIASFDWRHPVK